MATKTEVFILLSIVMQIHAISLREQLNHINEVRRSSQLQNEDIPSRRSFEFNRYEGGTVLGVPSGPSHLPAAEPILPGHTLLRPALGMLKSAIKFPHRENENGEGVYGHSDNIGMRYDGKNERVLYSGFRKMFSNDNMVDRRKPSKSSSRNPIIILILLSGSADTKTSLHLDGTKTGYDARRDDLINDSTDEFENNNDENSEGEKIHEDDGTAAMKEKSKWFWDTKDMFNHKIIPRDALEYADFLPPVNDSTRDWWFYNQVDYGPLGSRRSEPLTINQK